MDYGKRADVIIFDEISNTDHCTNCYCEECLDNAEYDVDGMCYNCRHCKDNNYGNEVYGRRDCPSHPYFDDEVI